MKSSAETPGGSAGSRSTLGLVVAALLSLLAPALTGCGGEEVVAVRPAQDCSECHSPLRHPGRFSVLRHEATFGGERFGCLDCHGDPFTTVGSSRCLACHRDGEPAFVSAHTVIWGDDCLACHDGRRFSGDAFDHEATAFPLEGAHRARSCPDCHAGARSLEEFRGAEPTCGACHHDEDPHAGELGDACGVCHEPTGWSGATFEHGFALDRHRRTADGGELRCSDCHGEPFGIVSSSTCRACHTEMDADFSRRHVDDWGEDCLACHDGARFSGDPFDHGGTGFALLGRHRSVGCSACHRGVTDFDGFADAPRSCHGCHSGDDPHDGQFGTDCGACHDPGGWDDARHVYELLHDDPDAPACSVCHPDAPDSFVSYTCYGCHPATRTLRDHERAGVEDFSDDCMSCHPLGG